LAIKPLLDEEFYDEVNIGLSGGFLLRGYPRFSKTPHSEWRDNYYEDTQGYPGMFDAQTRAMRRDRSYGPVRDGGSMFDERGRRSSSSY